ncbi:MAG: hypothetical protein JXB29_02370 [Sedimentisphaerales bacterium]|nr:hypothetical protein [Sedimentisphaerales bacterium]
MAHLRLSRAKLPYYWTSGSYVQLEKVDLVNIRGGKKSMIYDYNNTGVPDDIVPFYSEAYRDFALLDWTAVGQLKALR